MNNDSYLPKYVKIKNEIENLIQQGKIKPGEKIPTEHTLAEEFNASRHTVRKAISILCQQGILAKKQGVGTFLKEDTGEASYNIGFISISLHDYIFADILQGVDNILHEKGYQILLGNSRDDQSRERDILTEFLDKNVDGLIIEPAQSAFNYPNLDLLEHFVDKKIPVLVLDSKLESEKLNYIIVDDQKGGYLATNYLLENNHQEIGIIYKGLHQPALDRFAGYKKALEEKGIPIYNDYVKPYYISEFKDPIKFKEEIKKLTNELINLKKSPTAIFCFNDQIAVLVKEILFKEKIRVPEDISLLGFDDSKLVQLDNISIASIAHPKEKAGEKAAKIILENINNNMLELKEKVVFTPNLVKRKSVVKRAEK